MFENYIVVIVLCFALTVDCQQCERLVSLPDAHVVLKYNIHSVEGNVQLVNPNNKVIFQALCIGTTCLTPTYLNSSLAPTGNIATGKFHIQLDSFGDGKQGSYIFSGPGGLKLKCFTLYMLGKPRPSNISGNRVPHEGETVTLTCKSTSTTDPPGHGLLMSYNWTRDGTMLTTGGRFTILANTAATLTITTVQRNDEQSQYRCTATEEMGQTSDSSAAFNITVYYGPDNIAFNTTGVSQAFKEGERFTPVACLADCKPSCTFRWMREQTSVSTSAILDLGDVAIDEQGEYICVATHSVYSKYTLNKTFSVTVIHGPDTVTLSPPSINYTEMKGYTMGDITCSAVCNPECTYMWSKVDTSAVIRNNAILNLGQLSKEEAGSYICSAKNPNSSATRNGPTVNVNVIYGPGTVSLFPSTTIYTRTEGDIMGDISCSSTCYPNCTYTWSKVGTSGTLKDSAVLNLGQVMRQQAGAYICTATNPRSSAKQNGSTVEVKVKFGPDTASISPSMVSYTVNENQPISMISCSASCYPTCIFIWRKTTTVPSSALDNQNLTLGQVTRDEAGTYQCEATNPSTNRSVTVVVNVNVRYGPDTVRLSVPSVLTLTESERVLNVTCSSDCWPSCNYTWRNVTNKAILSRNRSLTFGPIDRFMADTYRCDMANTAYTKTAGEEFKLLVQYAPDVSIVQSASSLTEGLPLTLICSANGYPSHYTYTGFKQTVGTTTIPNDNTEETGVRDNISVRISSLALQDTGLYTCTVHNNISDIDGNLIQSAVRLIDIKVKPHIFLVENRFAGPTRGHVNIFIPIYSNPMFNTYGFQRQESFPLIEDERYEFQEKNSSIVTEFYGKSVTLHGRVLQITIQNLTENDFGLYTFWISNEIGNTSAAVNVSARSIPSLPTQLNVTVIGNKPIFEWKKGFNGGFVQTFLLQMSSTTDEQLWINRTSLLETDTVYLSDTGLFRVNITGLEVGHFDARLIAYNALGNADPVNFPPFEIINYSDKETTEPSNGAIIGAAAGGALGGLFVLGGFIFVLIRRRPFFKGKSKEDRAALRKDHALKDIAEHDGDDDIPDEVENPMYVGAGESANVYSKPVKKTTPQIAPANPGDIYAVVDKPKGKKKKGKTTASTSGHARKLEDLQETYENAGFVSSEPSQERKKNADGLIYADLVFANPPKGQRRLVIHGIDEMTEYADVDLTKKAEPLPDSDEEK